MAIAECELERNFIVVDEHATVRQVRDRVAATGNDWTYVVVWLVSGQCAVLCLSEIIEALQKWGGEEFQPEVLDAVLRDVPGLLAPWAAHAVEQADMETGEAKRLARRTPGGRLVVLAGGQVVGVLVGRRVRKITFVDLDWLCEPAQAFEPGVLTDEVAKQVSQPPPPPEPELQIEPEKRWINAEIQDHDPAEPLRMGEVVTLAFDVDTEARETALAAGGFGYRFRPDEQTVTLTVQLESDDFEIYTEPQKLRVPRTGRSKGKARFDVEPKHEGEGVINALFLKDGNFVQLMTLKLRTGLPGQPGLVAADTLGRPVDAAFAVQPRDVNLTILNTGAGFQVIMSGAVGAMATLPITLAQLDQMIAQVRQELLKIVHLGVGPDRTRIYQVGIDIPPEVDRLVLQQLAKAGYRLYQQIFYGPAADAQANLLGDRLRQMARQETLKIQIFSQQFMLPWGMLYVADEYDPDDVDPEMFLGLKHIIEHIPLQPGMKVIDTTVDSQPGLAVSLNVNADIDRQMGMPLIAGQRSYWEQIGQAGGVEVIVRESGDEVTRALADVSTADQILYFFCHAISKSLAERGGPDDSTLVLSGDQRVTLEDLNLFASPRKTLPGAPLVFINACESAELSPLFYDGFVPYFMAKGARGVIGTECETPALFAAEWARRFFDRFLAGEPLGQIFLGLRREFYYGHGNLLGLLYALYVDGDTQVVPGVNLVKVG
ncbi:MAG TPA: CHAT domain-containing protein [Anaerolineae bacterium]|nr:CHAT domain-containing protein [Anaerolineae bacterium]